MVEYCVSQMLNALASTEIPNEWEREFVEKTQYKKKGTFSIQQYNRVLILYNKYIGVPSGDMQVSRDYNYGDSNVS